MAEPTSTSWITAAKTSGWMYRPGQPDALEKGQRQPDRAADKYRQSGINTLASNNTSGGRVVYVDAGGTLVANGVGAGLEIDSGAIRIDADAVPLPGGGDGNGDAGFLNRNTRPTQHNTHCG